MPMDQTLAQQYDPMAIYRSMPPDQQVGVDRLGRPVTAQYMLNRGNTQEFRSTDLVSYLPQIEQMQRQAMSQAFPNGFPNAQADYSRMGSALGPRLNTGQSPYRQQPNPMMGFNPLMGGYGGGTGRFDGSQMPQFAGPDPAMGGPRNNGNAFPGGGYPRYGGGGYQQPSQNYGNIAALFSQLFGGGFGQGGSTPNYGGGAVGPYSGGIVPGATGYGGGGGNPFGGGFNPYQGILGGQGGSPVNSYNPFGNMMGSAGPNPLMGGFSSPGGGMFGGQGFGQGYGGGYNAGQNPFGYSPQQLQAGQNPSLYTPQGMR